MKKTICLIAVLFNACVLADTIVVPITQQGDASLPKPVRGMLMPAVETQFGKPISVQGPIGSPPITQWHYEHYTVIFENDHVVHTVNKFKPKATNETEKPATTEIETH